MSNPVRVREVDSRDIEYADEIAAMHKACFAYDIDRPSLDHGVWWIGYDGDEPACFAGLWPSRNWPKAGYLARSGVLPLYRGLGLQRRLIRLRERRARALGYRFVVTDTCDNPHSSNNLIAAGYRMFVPPKLWGPDGSNYWRKEL
jgi:GNAT superfamily N-acetyltransferase